MRCYYCEYNYVAAFYKQMYGEQGFKAVHKTEHLVKFIGKGYSFFFLECLH